MSQLTQDFALALLSVFVIAAVTCCLTSHVCHDFIQPYLSKLLCSLDSIGNLSIRF